MLEIATYSGFRRIKGSLIIGATVGIVGMVFATIFPSFEDAGAEDIADSFPPAMREMFGVEAMGSIEGFLAVEVYNFVWVLLFGIYFAYTAGGLIANDRESGYLDLLLTYPISRRQLLVERVGALLVPITLINVLGLIFIFIGVTLIGESIPFNRLVMVHVLSVPYFLVCIGIGVLFSVIFVRAETAQRLSFGAVFILWLFESITATVDNLDWIGYASPTRYYNPTDILVHGDYAFVHAIIMLIGFAILVIFSSILLQRNDI